MKPRSVLLLLLVCACSDDPEVVPILPGTPSVGVVPQGAPAVPAQPVPGAGPLLVCNQPGANTCIQCPSDQPCFTPTMASSCQSQPGAEFGNVPCTLQNAIGRCIRPNGMIMVFYGGPPRNHSARNMDPMCRNGMQGTFEALP